MIGFFIGMVFRFFITALAIYLALTLLRSFIRMLQGNTPPPQHPAPPDQAPKPKVEYKDVQDAKFTDLREEQSKDHSSQ